MTIQEALQITTVREDELPTINKENLDRVIESTEKQRFLTLDEKKSLEAWKTIKHHMEEIK